jgi:hypothetical protein
MNADPAGAGAARASAGAARGMPHRHRGPKHGSAAAYLWSSACKLTLSGLFRVNLAPIRNGPSVWYRRNSAAVGGYDIDGTGVTPAAQREKTTTLITTSPISIIMPGGADGRGEGDLIRFSPRCARDVCGGDKKGGRGGGGGGDSKPQTSAEHAPIEQRTAGSQAPCCFSASAPWSW